MDTPTLVKLERLKQERKDSQKGRLRAHREAAGLSQAQVAEAMGVSQPAVKKWEDRDDPGEHWPKMAKLYGVRLQYPSEPFNAEKREEWMKWRNGCIRRHKPNVPIIGAGKYSQATGKPL